MKESELETWSKVLDGVATPKEASEIRRLDAAIDLDNSPVEELLRVARLMISPMYQYERALPIIFRVLQRDPENPCAIYWYSYCVVYYLMDDQSVRKARNMIETWLAAHKDKPESMEASGALFQILMEVCSESGAKTCPYSERIMLLEESIRLTPDWTYNRWLLADLYFQCRRDEDAVRQLELAWQNMVQPDPDWDLLTEQFETIVTGRADAYIAEDLRQSLRI